MCKDPNDSVARRPDPSTLVPAHVLEHGLLGRVEADHHAVVPVRDPVALEAARLSVDGDVDACTVVLQATPILVVDPIVANV